MDAQCKALTKGGTPCTAQPVRPSGWCYWHDPALDQVRQENRRKGGAARSNKARAKRSYEKEQLTLGEVNGLLSITLKATINRQLEPGRASAIASVAKAMKDIAVAVEIEDRLTALERTTERQNTKGRPA